MFLCLRGRIKRVSRKAIQVKRKAREGRKAGLLVLAMPHPGVQCWAIYILLPRGEVLGGFVT